MNTSAIHAVSTLLRSCGIEMLGNASYMRDELPRLAAGIEVKERIRTLCEELTDLGQETINDSHELADRIKPEVQRARIVPMVERMLRWLDETIQKMEELARSLEVQSETDPGVSLAQVLVAESAANARARYKMAQESARHLADT